MCVAESGRYTVVLVAADDSPENKKKTPFLKHQRRKLAEKSCVQGESGCRTLALVHAVEEDDAINGRNV